LSTSFLPAPQGAGIPVIRYSNEKARISKDP
jgi:hypothetical protein